MSNIQQPAPDASRGERTLASFPRKNGEELRVTLSEFKGNHYLAFRKWYEGRDGERRPSKEGVSFRQSEIATIANAIEEALRQLEGRPAPPDPTEAW